jgi:hypothetical protein
MQFYHSESQVGAPTWIRTADFQTTTGLRQILKNKGNRDDSMAFIEERRLPVMENSV